jgi:hypothetical protein
VGRLAQLRGSAFKYLGGYKVADVGHQLLIRAINWPFSAAAQNTQQNARSHAPEE